MFIRAIFASIKPRTVWDKQLVRTISESASRSPSFDEDFSASHIPINNTQRFMLALGSSIMCLVNPRRPDNIAIMGETTGLNAAKYMLERMISDSEGSRILKDKPRINSSTVDLEMLRKLPNHTFGRKYMDFLETNKVTPDSRSMVQFVDDIELAYVIQRYREVHDLMHTILEMPTNMLGEVTVKWIEGFQTKLPMCVFGGLFGSVRLAPKQRFNYVKHYLPWAIRTGKTCKFFMNIYFEERWEQPLVDLQNELNIVPLVLQKRSPS